MKAFIRELRFAARNLIRHPGFSPTGVSTLALGLGAAVAIFAVVNGVVLKALPYPAADRLVSVYHRMTGEGFEGEWPLTRHTYLLFRDENRVFDGMGAYRPVEVSVTDQETTREERAALATPGMWDVLGVEPAAGRILNREDSRPGAPRVAVLGHDPWERRFGGDPGVVGRSLEVAGETFEVVGVAEDGLGLPSQEIGGQQEGNVALWLPYELDPSLPVTDQFRLRVVARRRGGVEIDAVRRELERLTGLLSEEYPQVFSPRMVEQVGLSTRARSLRDTILGGVDRTLWIVFGAVGVVLLIACANVANLFLVRTEGRRNEVALRTALGAGRGTLTLHFLAESAALTSLAAFLGLGLAWLGVETLLSLQPPGIPRLEEVTLGWTSLAFTGGLVVAVTLFLGAYPVLRFGFRPSTSELGSRTPGRDQGPRGSRIRNGLVVGQVALALTLLVAAGVLLESFQKLRQVKPGFSAEDVLAVEVSLPEERFDDPRRTATFWRQAVDRLESAPGIREAAIGPVPLEMGTGCSAMFVEGRPVSRENMENIECTRIPTLASPGYFDLLDIRVVEGRGLTADDTDRRTGAAVVSRDLAERLWPGESALGQGLKPRRPGPPFYRVVGVVEPIRGEGLDTPTTEMVFLPLLPLEGEPGWNPLGTNVLVETSSGAATGAAPTVRRTLSRLVPDAAFGDVRSMEQVVDRAMIGVTFPMLLLGIAAAVALGLGTVGLYGVVAHRVGSRAGEIGVRMALGASTGDIQRLVFRQAMALAGGGLAVGLVASVFLNRALRSLLYGVAPNDPVAMAGSALLLFLTVAAAAYIPAFRATRVDPGRTLRAE